MPDLVYPNASALQFRQKNYLLYIISFHLKDQKKIDRERLHHLFYIEILQSRDE